MNKNSQNTNIYKPKPVKRPSSGVQSQKSSQQQQQNKKEQQNFSNTQQFPPKNSNNEQDMLGGLGLTGTSISNKTQWPQKFDKYQLTKPDILKSKIQSQKEQQKTQQNSSNNNGQNNGFKKYSEQNNNKLDDSLEEYLQEQEFLNQQHKQNFMENEQQQQIQQRQQEGDSNIFDSYIQEQQQQKSGLITDQNKSSIKQQNDFKTYMQYKMVNPDVKQIYSKQQQQQMKTKQQNKNNYDNSYEDDNQSISSSQSELKKQASKPFQTKGGRLDSARKNNDQQGKDQQQQGKGKKQQEIGRESMISNVSSGSTYLSSNYPNSKIHSQKPSQDLQQLLSDDVSQTIQSEEMQGKNANQNQTQQQYKKPLKLNELTHNKNKQKMVNSNSNKQKYDQVDDQFDIGEGMEEEEQKDQEQQQQQKQQKNSNLNFDNWVVQDINSQQQKQKQQVRKNPLLQKGKSKKVEQEIENKSQEIQDLENYLWQMKQKNNGTVPQNFDQMVEDNLCIMASEDINDISTHQFQEIDEENESSQMEIRIGKQVLLDQQEKLKQLNQMLEESNDDFSQVSFDEIKRNLLFITEVGKKSQKFEKEQDQDKLSQKSYQSDSKSVQSQKLRKSQKEAYFIEMNKKLAWMEEDEKLQMQMECDRLPQEAQDRIEFLLEDIDKFDEQEEYNKLVQQSQTNNPYKNQENGEKEIEIEQQIEEIRSQLVLDPEQANFDMHQGVLEESVLPKDKNLRDEAENRLLQDKLKDINQQLYQMAINEQLSHSQANNDKKENNNNSDSRKSIGQSTNRLQIEGLCENLRQAVDYTPGPLLQHRLNEMEAMRQNHLDALEKLEKLKAQEGILEDFKIIKAKIDESLARIKRGDILEEDESEELIQLKKKAFEQQQVLDLQKYGVQKNLEKKQQAHNKHEYSILKEDLEIAHGSINSQFEECQQKEQILMAKIEDWKKQMEVFDIQEQEQLNKKIDEEDEELQKINERNDKLTIELIDQEIERKVLEKNPDLYIDEFYQKETLDQDQDLDDQFNKFENEQKNENKNKLSEFYPENENIIKEDEEFNQKDEEYIQDEEFQNELKSQQESNLDNQDTTNNSEQNI